MSAVLGGVNAWGGIAAVGVLHKLIRSCTSMVLGEAGRPPTTTYFVTRCVQPLFQHLGSWNHTQRTLSEDFKVIWKSDQITQHGYLQWLPSYFFRPIRVRHDKRQSICLTPVALVTQLISGGWPTSNYWRSNGSVKIPTDSISQRYLRLLAIDMWTGARSVWQGCRAAARGAHLVKKSFTHPAQETSLLFHHKTISKLFSTWTYSMSPVKVRLSR